MNTVRLRWLALIGVLAGLVGWLMNFWANHNGYPVPVLDPLSLLTILLIVVLTLALGIRVRRWRNGNRSRPLDPILAARTLVLAQATAYAGAVLLGWHSGILVDQLALWSVRTTHTPTWGALEMMAGGIVMVIVGLVVEQFCKLPPEDGEPGGGGGTPKTQGEGEYA